MLTDTASALDLRYSLCFVLRILRQQSCSCRYILAVSLWPSPFRDASVESCNGHLAFSIRLPLVCLLEEVLEENLRRLEESVVVRLLEGRVHKVVARQPVRMMVVRHIDAAVGLVIEQIVPRRGTESFRVEVLLDSRQTKTPHRQHFILDHSVERMRVLRAGRVEAHLESDRYGSQCSSIALSSIPRVDKHGG